VIVIAPDRLHIRRFHSVTRAGSDFSFNLVHSLLLFSKDYPVFPLVYHLILAIPSFTTAMQ